MFFIIFHLRWTRVQFGILVLYVVLPPWKYHLVFVRWFRPRNELHTAGELSVRFSDFLPSICATTRRLHHGNHRGWWQSIWLAPVFVIGAGHGLDMSNLMIVGGIATIACFVMLLVWLIAKGTEGDNRFGSNPLATDA